MKTAQIFFEDFVGPSKSTIQLNQTFNFSEVFFAFFLFLVK